ncbi:MAG: DPP IV N-terminal domain-containing protein, partial [Polyangiaceae bacterium]
MACAADVPSPHPPAFVPPEHGFLAFAHSAEKDLPKPAPKSIAPLPPVSEDFPRLFAKTRGFKLGAPHDIRPTEDGKHVFFLRAEKEDPRQSLFEIDLTKDAEVLVLSPETLLGDKAENLTKEERARRERMRVTTSGFTSYEATKDGNDVVAVLSGKLYHWSRKTGQATELRTGDGAVDPHLSPDGKRVAYVRNQDVYAIALEGGKEERITTGGTEKKTHGLAEFIAQEELDRERGFWWSPDSKSILYEEADTSKVETFYISDPAHPEHPPDANPYPRAGTANATLRFGIVSAHGGATKWIDFDNTKYAYVAQVSWQKNAPPTFYALDRPERNGLLFTANPSTGKTTPLLEEHDDAWLNVDASCPQWLDDGSAFLWSSEKSGSWELELHDKTGATKVMLANGEVGYRRLRAVDSRQAVAYFEASP